MPTAVEQAPLPTVHLVRLLAGKDAIPTPLMGHRQLLDNTASWSGIAYINERVEGGSRVRDMIGVSLNSWGNGEEFKPDNRILAEIAYYKKGRIKPRVVTYDIQETADMIDFWARRVRGFTTAGISFDKDYHIDQPWLSLHLTDLRASPQTLVTPDLVDLDRSPHLHAEIIPDIRFLQDLMRGVMEAGGVKLKRHPIKTK